MDLVIKMTLSLSVNTIWSRHESKHVLLFFSMDEDTSLQSRFTSVKPSLGEEAVMSGVCAGKWIFLPSVKGSVGILCR